MLVLKTVNVFLPTSDRMFPDGPGSDVVISYCLVYHSAAMMLSQPAMIRSAWEAEVQKMRTVYKAPIPEEQIQTIVSYLAGLQNAK
ncbi:MAG: cytochrome c [Methylocella sp.]